ncbi:MAG: sigma factor [Chitinophagaceae bacterium]
MVQEVFLRLWETRKEMQRIDHLGAWLYRVAANLSLNRLKRAAMEGNILQRIKRLKL